MTVLANFGAQANYGDTVHFMDPEVISYLSGFNVVFHNVSENATVSVLSLGEGLSAVPCIVFSPSRESLVVCEERRDGSSVALYARVQGFEYALKARIPVSQQAGATLLHASYVSPSRVICLTGAPDYSLLAFDSSAKSAVASYRLSIQVEGVLADAEGGEGAPRAPAPITRARVLRLSEKEVVVLAGPHIRCIKLGASTAKVLPPSGLRTLLGRRTFTDAIFLSQALRPRFPTLPIDFDRLILLATQEGTIVFMYNNVIISEYLCDKFTEMPITALLLVQDPSVFEGPGAGELLQLRDDFPGGAAGADNPSAAGAALRSIHLFNDIAAPLREQERASAFLFAFTGAGVVHVYGLLFSVVCSFISQEVYSSSSKVEGKLSCQKLFKHLLSYNASAVIDHALARVSPVFAFSSVSISPGEKLIGCFGGSEGFRCLFCLKAPQLLKKCQEVDRVRAFAELAAAAPSRHSTQGATRASAAGPAGSVGGGAAGSGAEDELLDGEEIVVAGQVVDFADMSVNPDSLSFLSQDASTDIINFLSDPYSMQANPELFLLKPPMPSGHIQSIACNQVNDNMALVTADRVLRIFSASRLCEKSFTRFGEVLGASCFHPSGRFLLVASSEYILLCSLRYDRVVTLHHFPVPFCKCMCFLNGGDILCAASGSYLYVYDFYSRSEIARITDFSSRIAAVCPIIQGFSSLKYASEVFVVCSDGSVVRYDVADCSRVSSTVVRGAHMVSACVLSAAYYLYNQDKSAASADAKPRSGPPSAEAQLLAAVNQLPPNPILICVTSDGSLRVLDPQCNELGRISSVLNAEISRATGDQSEALDVAGAGSSGALGAADVAATSAASLLGAAAQAKQYHKGRALTVCNVYNHLVVGYEYGCVGMRNISGVLQSLLAGRQVDAESAIQATAQCREYVVTVTNTSITGLQPLCTNNGVVVCAADGLVYTLAVRRRANDPTPLDPRPTIRRQAMLSLAPRGSKEAGAKAGGAGSAGSSASGSATGPDGVSAGVSAVPVPGSGFITVSQENLDSVLSKIRASRQKVLSTKRALEEKVRFLEHEFSRDVSQIRQQTAEMVSQHLSEYSRIETEHETKSVLLRRQITSNENTFKDSLAALQGQYQKRLVAMNDRLAALAGEKLMLDGDTEKRVAAFREETEQIISDLVSTREAEICKLSGVIDSVRAEIREAHAQNELLFKLSEEGLYGEATQLTNLFERKLQVAKEAYAKVLAYNEEVQARYEELDAALVDQKRKLLAMEKSIQDQKDFISSQRRDIQNIKLEIEAKDETIASRERRVLELRKKIRELSKVKFVLDYKIREYSRQVEPRDMELGELKGRLAEMTAELSGYRTSLLQLKTNHRELERKNHSMRGQVKGLADKVSAIEERLSFIRTYVNGIGAAATNPQAALAAQAAAKQQASAAVVASATGAAPRREGVRSATVGAHSLPPLGRSRPATTRQAAATPAAAGASARVQVVPGANAHFRAIAVALRTAHLALVSKVNAHMQEKERRFVEGNFTSLETTVVNLERKLARSRTNTQHSTSTVIAQNATLLQEINHLRRELHVAQVNANAESKIDPRLLEEFENRKREIARLKAIVRRLEAGAVSGAQFIPEVE